MKSVRLAPVVAWRLIVRSRSHSRGLRDSPRVGGTSPPLAHGQLSRPSLPVRSGIASSCVLFERPRIRGALGLVNVVPFRVREAFLQMDFHSDLDHGLAPPTRASAPR